jgi:signal transduction histidine kinase
MRDQPNSGGAGGLTRETAAKRPGFGLSWQLLALTILFVMVSTVLIYVPSIANFRGAWLTDRMTMADAAGAVLSDQVAADIPRQAQDDLLRALGAIAIAIRTGEVSRLIAAADVPPSVDEVVDLRALDLFGGVVGAFNSLLSAKPRILRVITQAESGATLELLMTDRGLHEAMLDYSINIVWLAAVVSIVTGFLLYFSLNRLLVRPMRKLSANMVAFSAAPEDPSRIIKASGRGDEVGVAEEHLAQMQRDLQVTLREQKHLADLGLAVSKINHDLRNMLAAAQLFSDRLGSLPDPNVQRFAPKLIAALDRAIAYCTSTLAYGRAREPAPARRLLALDKLVEEAADVLGLAGHATIRFENRVPAGLEVDADPDQLFRVLVNLGRNAVQALEGGEGSALVRRVTISAARAADAVNIKVADTGPGVPEKARAHLFRAFAGSARPGGTGLGLAIAAELVGAHGGTISLADHGGPGAVFAITIPDRPGAEPRGA